MFSFIAIREKIQRLKYVINEFKYDRGRHFYFVFLISVVLMIIIFSIVLVNQRANIRRKENILKSFYEDFEDGSDLETLELKDESYIGNDGKNKFEEGEITEGKDNTIRVYICGYVTNPDVYELTDGARIIDLINMAGGSTEDACLEAVNLASKLADGQKIYIPSHEEISKGTVFVFTEEDSFNTGYNNLYQENSLININFASQKELESLPGIGPVISQSIIDYRNKNGLFNSIDELKRVKGIGEKKYQEIKDLITV